MKRPGIPAVPTNLDSSTHAMFSTLKENMELITGVRNGKLPPVPTNATLPELIAAFNTLVDRLNAG